MDTKKPVKPTKKQQTDEKIRLAILRIENGRPRIVDKGRKLSISSAAEEAEVSTATIHNRHPGLAEYIRKKTGTDVRQQRKSIAVNLKVLRDRNKELREDIKQLSREVELLASINASLMLKNDQLNAILQSDNVSMLPKKE